MSQRDQYPNRLNFFTPILSKITKKTKKTGEIFQQSFSINLKMMENLLKRCQFKKLEFSRLIQMV